MTFLFSFFCSHPLIPLNSCFLLFQTIRSCYRLSWETSTLLHIKQRSVCVSVICGWACMKSGITPNHRERLGRLVLEWSGTTSHKQLLQYKRTDCIRYESSCTWSIPLVTEAQHHTHNHWDSVGWTDILHICLLLRSAHTLLPIRFKHDLLTYSTGAVNQHLTRVNIVVTPREHSHTIDAVIFIFVHYVLLVVRLWLCNILIL